MGMFTNGLVVRVGLLGVGAGLLVAPLSSEEMRHLVNEGVAALCTSLPGSRQRPQSVLQVSVSPSQAATQAQLQKPTHGYYIMDGGKRKTYRQNRE